jgi:hypothetical protein
MIDFKSELREILKENIYDDHENCDDSCGKKADYSELINDIIALFISKLPHTYDVMKRVTPPDDPRKVVQEAWERGINNCLADIKGKIYD